MTFMGKRPYELNPAREMVSREPAPLLSFSA
jgi:hypothetical protein